MSILPTVPPIAPLPPESSRPRWSVMIPTYNCADYLRLTLHSVLQQAFPPDQMQIEVVDDCSQDDPAAVVAELGQGRVGFYRHASNQGAIANFNHCIQRSRGEIVHILHGDDKVLPGFYPALDRAFQQQADLGAAFCRPIYIDEADQQRFIYPLEQPQAGIMPHLLDRLGVVCMIQTPTIAVRRSVYETLGGFHPELFHAGDWEMWQRVASFYPVWYEPQPLACYRTHTHSHTSSLVRSAANIANTRRAIAIAHTYLPTHLRDRVTAQAQEFYALYAFESACWQLVRRDPAAAIAQLSQAWQCSHTPQTLGKMAQFVAAILANRTRKALAIAGNRPTPIQS